jgi:hypothetical protein
MNKNQRLLRIIAPALIILSIVQMTVAHADFLEERRFVAQERTQQESEEVLEMALRYEICDIAIDAATQLSQESGLPYPDWLERHR